MKFHTQKRYLADGPLTLTQKEFEDGMISLSLSPVRTIIMQIMDELVRQGIYLTQPKQEGAKLMIEILGDKLKEADKIRKKREDQQRRIREHSQ